mgnify:FL=1
MRNSLVLYSTILLTALALLLIEPIFLLISGSKWMEAIFGSLEPTVFTDVCALVVLTALCFMISSIKELVTDKAAANSLVIIIPIMVLLLGCRITHTDDFTPFCLIPVFKYADVPIVALAVSIIEAISKMNEKPDAKEASDAPSDSILLFDDIDAKDLLGRMGAVKRYARIMMGSSNANGSFGVAVTGGWGTGKSWFMNALKEELDKQNQTTFVFRPWLYADRELTISFCKCLKSVLDEKGEDTSNLQVYMKDILESSGNIGNVASHLLGLRSRASREELIQNVKEELGQSPKRIYVFMDECDRLSKGELLQVFSLIRNTCDFQNLCYVLAYDASQIDRILRNVGGLSYAAKMINLTIPLEPISNEVIIDSLASIFERRLDEKTLMKELGKVDFTVYLPTLRELKRFWNQAYSDYQRQKSVIDCMYMEMGDWLVLELIRYHDLNLYMCLQYTPSYVLSSSEEGWDAPSWMYAENKENKICSSLLHYLFPKPNKDKLNDHVLGIANKSWHDLYFADTLPKGYRDNHEYANSIVDGTFADKMTYWAEQNDIGLIYILAYLYRYVGRIKTIESLTNYIWGICDNIPVEHEMTSIVSGYVGKNARHDYRFINIFIKDLPVLLEIYFQVYDIYIDNDVNEETAFEDYIKTTNRPLELMGLMLGKLKDETDTEEGCYITIDACIPILWERIISEDKESDEDTLNILEILHDCTFEDTFDRFVLPLVTKAPKRWLGATLKVEKDLDKEFLLLRTRESHALFGMLDNTQEYIDRIKVAVIVEDKPFVEEYNTLFNHIKVVVEQLNKQKGAENINLTVSSLQKDNYPMLSQIKSPGMELYMPLGDAISQITESPFWKNEDLRIHREPSGAYFAQKI